MSPTAILVMDINNPNFDPTKSYNDFLIWVGFSEIGNQSRTFSHYTVNHWVRHTNYNSDINLIHPIRQDDIQALNYTDTLIYIWSEIGLVKINEAKENFRCLT